MGSSATLEAIFAQSMMTPSLLVLCTYKVAIPSLLLLYKQLQFASPDF